MPLAVGTRLGPYEITGLLGAGGMGEVYRARDSKLQRDVAIKVLPEALAHDTERLARFEREARTLASLNHPHIAHIYGLEESDGIKALVLELVEGEDLAQRIARGPISLEQALPIARQIAEALEAAHEQGIIHRDLKPANIKVRPDGAVKVLDFGLAKALDSAPPAIDTTASPTITSPALMTGGGVLLGTAAYMAPEQARGKSVDKRADIWAFGCVLFEMLTGQQPFAGELISDVLASVLKSEPHWQSVPDAAPIGVRRLLRRCLEKDPRRRLQAIGDARLEIEDLLAGAPDEISTAGNVSRQRAGASRRWVVAFASGMLLIAVTALAAWALLRTVATPLQQVRFAIVPSAALPLAIQGNDRDIAISPEGTRIIYRAGGRPPQLVVRELDQLDGTPIADTANPRAPFFSPDGLWVGFFSGAGSGTELKRVSMAGGSALTICKVNGAPRGASWGDDDTIVFATSDTTQGLMSVPALRGGEPKGLTKPDPGQGDHLRPFVLPGAKGVLFTIDASRGGNILAAGQITKAQIAVLDLVSGERRMLIQGASQAEYVESGHLVYVTAGGVRAVRFDLASLRIVGDPIPVVEPYNNPLEPMLAANFAVSLGGTFVYVPTGGVGPQRTLVWVNRQGREELIHAEPRPYASARISGDGSRVVVDVRDQNNDIWVWDFARQRLTPLTFDPTPDILPIWTPNSRRIVFASGRNGGPSNLFWQSADGTGPTEPLAPSPHQQIPTSLSPDGKRLVFQETPSGNSDIGLLTLGETPTTEPLLHTSFEEQNGDISPDGRWLAYQSDDASRQTKVWVRPFPNVESGVWQVSAGVGTRPLWAQNGRELFYLNGNNLLTSVAVQTAGSTFGPVGNPTTILNTPYWAALNGRPYDASRDGQRFLMIKEAPEENAATTPASLIVVLNGFEELKRLVPTK